MGYAFALLYSIVTQFFPTFPVKVLYVLASIAGRFIILTPDTVVTGVIVSIFDIAMILLMYHNERHQRKLFQSFYDYREELSKFKSLLAYHLPEKIIILNKDLNKIFFANSSFTKNFKTQNIAQILKIFSHLKINAASIDLGNFTEYDQLSPTASDQELTLSSFLRLYKDKIMKSSIISSFNVENTRKQNLIRITYSVRVFHINWDGSDAIAIMIDDLTQQQAILALKIADENKERVLTTISHELRTPINGILGVTQVIESEYQDPKLLSYVKTAKVCSSLLLNLINSILDMTQIRNNSIKLTPTFFKLEEILDEIDSIFRPQCEPKGLNFQILTDNDVPESITTDRNRLTQILINLLANAFKFTFHGGVTIHIKNIADEDEIQFIIQDTGIGIKEKDQKKLFQMFGRLDSGGNLNSRGVGLGLTISNHLVNLLNPFRGNSKISFESVYGEGTTFFFSISTRLRIEPLQLDSQENENDQEQKEEDIEMATEELESFWADNNNQSFAFRSRFGTRKISLVPSFTRSSYPSFVRTTLPPQSAKAITTTFHGESEENLKFENPKFMTLRGESGPFFALMQTQQQGVQVLVVDDNSFNILVAKSLLVKNGFIVTSAFNGEDAIKKARNQDQTEFFKIILMDCQMPIMDGFQATKILVEMMDNGEIPRTPIVALTANDSKKDQEKCTKSGMSGFLSKPLKEEDLHKLLDKFVKN